MQDEKSTLEKVRTGEWEMSESADAQKRAQEAYPRTSQQDDVDDGIVDTVVTDRMLRRVLTFSGVPVVFAFLLYPGFYYLKVRLLTLVQQLAACQPLHSDLTCVADLVDDACGSFVIACWRRCQ